jgi:pilus assembly protein Flp/PilA
MKKLMRFFKDEDGATAVEYSIMAAAIAAVIAAIVYAIGTKVENGFSTLDGLMH